MRPGVAGGLFPVDLSHANAREVVLLLNSGKAGEPLIAVRLEMRRITPPQTVRELNGAQQSALLPPADSRLVNSETARISHGTSLAGPMTVVDRTVERHSLGNAGRRAAADGVYVDFALESRSENSAQNCWSSSCSQASTCRGCDTAKKSRTSSAKATTWRR